MKTIYHGFLSKSRIDHLVMPERYEEIGHTAFEYYNWFVDSTLVIPEGCRKLSYQAFNGCRSIKLLMLPSTLETLEPNSLGFSYPLGGRVVSMDVYVNRMYPPTSTKYVNIGTKKLILRQRMARSDVRKKERAV